MALVLVQFGFENTAGWVLERELPNVAADDSGVSAASAAFGSQTLHSLPAARLPKCGNGYEGRLPTPCFPEGGDFGDCRGSAACRQTFLSDIDIIAGRGEPGVI